MKCLWASISIMCQGLAWFAACAYAYEPEPFRTDEVDGRPFGYGKFAFVDRFSYSFRPDWDEMWEMNPQGFRVTGGSISSDELYTYQSLRKTLELNEQLFGELQYDRTEDFYSRYYRFVMGAGYKFAPDWSFALLGNVIPAKSDIDFYLQLKRQDNQGNLFRFVYVATDYFYNSKTSEDRRYATRPHTFFAEGRWGVHEQVTLSGWANYNTPLELEDLDEDFDYEYRQFRGGVAGSFKLSDTASLRLAYEGEHSVDSIDSPDPQNLKIRDMDRDYAAINLQFGYRLSTAFRTWTGARYFLLDENDARPNAAGDSTITARNEYMLYSIFGWQIGEKFSFWPALYLTWIDNQELFPLESALSSKHGELLAKGNLTLQYQFNEKMVGSFNPSWQFPGGPFGGFNVQFQGFF